MDDLGAGRRAQDLCGGRLRARAQGAGPSRRKVEGEGAGRRTFAANDLGAALGTTWAPAQGAASIGTTYDQVAGRPRPWEHGRSFVDDLGAGSGRRTFAAKDLGAGRRTFAANDLGAALGTTYDQVAGRPRPWEHGRSFGNDLGAGSCRATSLRSGPYCSNVEFSSVGVQRRQ